MIKYSEKVMDHFMNPKNVGRILRASGVGKAGSPICGDTMTVYIKVKDNVIVDIKFETLGCAAAIATSSMATELVKGKTIEEALKLTKETVAEALDGLPVVKMHCSLLAEDSLKAAIKDYRIKRRRARGAHRQSRVLAAKSAARRPNQKRKMVKGGLL